MENDAFERKGPTYGLTQPSEAHKEAIGSVVYRLSELMFGSLLASYVLGFIGFSSPQVAAVFGDGDLRILYPKVITYLFISMTFAYLTAGLYISYHAGILTMPHLPFSNLRWDFMVALLQAVLFGVSMLLPLWLPLCVGCILCASLVRQHSECKALVYKLKRKFIPDGNIEYKLAHLRNIDETERAQVQKQKKHLKDFKRLFAAELDKTKSLKFWWKVSRKTVIGAISLILAGLIVALIETFSLLSSEHIKSGVPLLAGAVFVGVMLTVNRVLAHRANFMYSNEAKIDIDKQFWDWIDELVKEGVNDAAQA